MILEINDEKEKIKIIYDNILIVFTKEVNKVSKYILEIEIELNNQTNKLNNLVSKAENSFQQYELLNYEIGTIKKLLLEVAGKITQKLLNDILLIKNPNEAIYLLIMIFYKIIKSIDNNEKINNNNIKWEILQKKCTYSAFNQYISLISKFFHNGLNKEDLDEAMPFLVNYEKLEEILKKFGNEYLIILEFIKINIDYNIKLNIIQNLYNGNLNKNNKINALQNEVNNLNSLLEKSKELFGEMEKELTILKFINLKMKNWTKNNKIFALNIIIKYNLHKQYNIIYEFSQTSEKEKYVIKLHSEFKMRENFLNNLFENKDKFNNGLNQKIPQSTINYLFNNEKNKYLLSLENQTKNKKNKLKHYKLNFLISQNFTKINNSLSSRENYGDGSSETNNTQSKSRIKVPSSINMTQIKNQNISAEKTTGRTKNEKDNFKLNNIIETSTLFKDDEKIKYNNFTERKNKNNKSEHTLILENNEIDVNCFYCYKSSI